MPSVNSKELDLDSLRDVVRNVFTPPPFGAQCRVCNKPLKLTDVDTKNYHLRCRHCYNYTWCVADGCEFCINLLGRPFVYKADVRVPIKVHDEPSMTQKKKKKGRGKKGKNVITDL